MYSFTVPSFSQTKWILFRSENNLKYDTFGEYLDYVTSCTIVGTTVRFMSMRRLGQRVTIGMNIGCD